MTGKKVRDRGHSGLVGGNTMFSQPSLGFNSHWWRWLTRIHPLKLDSDKKGGEGFLPNPYPTFNGSAGWK